MARPIRNTVDYFPHMIGDGKKIFFIETKYGNDGYATWFKILEKLATTDNHFLNLNNEQDVLFLSAVCKVDEKKLLDIITDLSKIGAINKVCWDKKIIWSDLFIESIQDAYSRRNNKCITFDSLCIRLQSLGIHLLDYCNEKDYNNTQSKVKKSKEEYNIEFSVFWDLYNKKVGDKNACERKWYKLKDAERQKIIDTLPNFLAGIKDKQFQAHPLTYLNQQRWNDEIKPIETVKKMVM